MLDLAIVGSGPAALSAALYAARAGLSVNIFEKSNIGGALPEIAHIANFPAFDGSGTELADAMRRQLKSLDVKIDYGECTEVYFGNEIAPASLTIDGEVIEPRSVLIATGSEPRPLPFVPMPPVSYCALCDAPLYKDKNILVIGGGNSAVGESLLLAEIADRVTLMTHTQLKAESTRQEQLRALGNVTILENTEPTSVNTAGYDAIFVYIGQRPATGFLPPEYLDEQSYIVTLGATHQIYGSVFAAGDVRSGTIKQAIVAAADGAAAAIEITKLLQG